MKCIACNGTGKWVQNSIEPQTCPICGWGNKSILGAATLAMSQHITNHHTMHEIHTAMSHGRLSLIDGKYIVAPDNDKCGICEGTGHVCDTCGESIPDDGDYLCIDCNRCASWNDGSPYKAGLLGWCNHRRREACYGNETCDQWVPNAGVEPRRGSDVGSNPLLADSGGDK